MQKDFHFNEVLLESMYGIASLYEEPIYAEIETIVKSCCDLM